MLLSDTVGFISDLPVQVTWKYIGIKIPYFFGNLSLLKSYKHYCSW